MKGLTVKAQRVRHNNGVCFCRCVCVLQHSIRISFNFLLLFLINYRHYLIQFCHNRSLSHAGSSIRVLLYVSFLILCLFIYGLARIQRRKINGKFRFALKVCMCVCVCVWWCDNCRWYGVDSTIRWGFFRGVGFWGNDFTWIIGY